MTENADLFLKQIAVGPMANFVYLIGSKRTRECLIVDPAWDTDAIVAVAEEDDMNVVGALVTHYHPDHVGGGMGGFDVPSGVSELLARGNAKIDVNKHEAEGLKLVTKISDGDMVQHDAGDVVEIGDVKITLLHTPGHTPGSQCFLVHDHLVAGDTLFVNGCGRVDLPGSEPDQMYDSLQTLGKLEDHVRLYPGHHYGGAPSSTMGEQKRTNSHLKASSLEQWRAMMG